MNAKHKLPKAADSWTDCAGSLGPEAWRCSAFTAESSRRLSGWLRGAVSDLGSARAAPGSEYYDLTEKIALLSDSGSVISGGGPGSLGSPTGAFRRQGFELFGLSIQFAAGTEGESLSGHIPQFPSFSLRKHMFVRLASAYVVMPGGFRHAGRVARGADPDTDRNACPLDSSSAACFGVECWPGSARLVS